MARRRLAVGDLDLPLDFCLRQDGAVQSGGNAAEVGKTIDPKVRVETLVERRIDRSSQPGEHIAMGLRQLVGMKVDFRPVAGGEKHCWMAKKEPFFLRQ